jgi:TraM recognition site of TraD and TraG
MGQVLDGGILLARLPKGVLGDETTKLLGSLVVASTWQAATARADRPEPARRDAMLIIDECQNFLNLPRSIDEMAAEARGYRLSLVLAHQDLTQLPRETAAAISANARNKIVFNCSPEDAHILARHTQPELDEHDLSHLDRYTAAARLLVHGAETPAFTLTTNPPPDPVGASDQVRARCAELTRARLPAPTKLTEALAADPDATPATPAAEEAAPATATAPEAGRGRSRQRPAAPADPPADPGSPAGTRTGTPDGDPSTRRPRRSTSEPAGRSRNARTTPDPTSPDRGSPQEPR